MGVENSREDTDSDGREEAGTDSSSIHTTTTLWHSPTSSLHQHHFASSPPLGDRDTFSSRLDMNSDKPDLSQYMVSNEGEKLLAEQLVRMFEMEKRREERGRVEGELFGRIEHFQQGSLNFSRILSILIRGRSSETRKDVFEKTARKGARKFTHAGSGDFEKYHGRTSHYSFDNHYSYVLCQILRTSSCIGSFPLASST